MSLTIKSKKDITAFLEQFANIASYDEAGQKHYFVFDEKKRGGQCTLMKTADGCWTTHEKGEDYCDPDEVEQSEEEVVKLIWNNRGAVNRVLRN